MRKNHHHRYKTIKTYKDYLKDPSNSLVFPCPEGELEEGKASFLHFFLAVLLCVSFLCKCLIMIVLLLLLVFLRAKQRILRGFGFWMAQTDTFYYFTTPKKEPGGQKSTKIQRKKPPEKFQEGPTS